MTTARSQAAGLAALEAIAALQAVPCRRCGYPHRAHLHYRDTPSAPVIACSRYRPPRRKFRFWRRT